MSDYTVSTPDSLTPTRSQKAEVDSSIQTAFSLAHYQQAAVAAAAFSSFGNNVQTGENISSLTSPYMSTASMTSKASMESSSKSFEIDSSLSSSNNGIASFGFTQEQVACVCEVLEQSGNIERLAR